jgi:hypothetical protein
MATLAEVVKKQRQGGRGVIGSLTSAIGQKTLETIDPRRMLNQRGLLTSLFPSLKAYQAGGGAERMSRASADLSSSTAPMLQEMNMKLDIVGTNTKITAKNTMMMPAMARDMNVMRQNIVKLVKLQGGKASTRADAFFMRARERESAYESQFGRSQPVTTTTPKPEKKDGGGSGILGLLGGALGLSAIIGTLSKAITSIPSLLLQGLSSIPNLIAAGLSSLTSLLAGGLKIGFDLAKGAASVVGSGLKSAGSSILSIIRAAAGFLMSGPGLAILGVGGVTALLAYLLANEKTQYGDSKTGSMTRDEGFILPDSEEFADASVPIPSGGYADTANEEALARVRARQRDESATDPGYIPPNATPSPAMQTAPTVAPPPTPDSTSPKLVPSVPPEELGGINYSSYAQTVGQRESGGDYKAVNTLGFLGKYQFGAAALEDMGLIKKGASKGGNKVLNDSSNWTIEGGKEAFLNNAALQEQTMANYTKQNFRSLKRLGVVNEETPPEKIAGYLASAHLVGPGGAAALSRGEVRKDAYGTSAQSYFKLGSASQGEIQPAPSTSGAQVAAATSAVSDSQSMQMQQPVVINSPTTNVSQGQGGGQISGIMADTLDKELASLLVDRMVGA